MRVRMIIAIGSLFLAGCSGQKPFVAEYDDSMTLKFVDKLSDSEKRAVTPTLVDVDEMSQQVENFCETGFDVPLYADLEPLLADADKAMSLDSALIYRPRARNEFASAIAGSEFIFRYLCAMQRRLEDYFQYVHKKGDYTQSVPGDNNDYIYHFEQNVADLLPITQAQNRYSGVKTAVLLELIAQYDTLTLRSDRERFWIAIERMLTELDLARSQTGYEMFQRRADGLSGKPTLLLDQLQSLQTTEIQPDIRARAASIIESAQKRLNKPLAKKDQQLIVTVDLNKKFMREVLRDTTSNRSSREELLLWFDRGYESPDPRLKVEYYTRAIQVDSLYAPAWNNRGNAFQAVGEYDAARADYDRALSLAPDFYLAYKNRGSLYLLKKEYDNALVDLNRAIDNDNRCALCYVDRGLVYMKLENYESALHDFDRAIELDASPAQTWNVRGLCRQKLGQREAALDDFTQAIARDPFFTPAYINRGNHYRRLRDEKKAIEDYSVAIDLDPANYSAYNNRALSHKNSGNFAAAIADHEQALEINPDDPVTYYNLGCVYWELENWQAVVQSWEKCLVFDPDNEAANEWLPLAEKQLRKQR